MSNQRQKRRQKNQIITFDKEKKTEFRFKEYNDKPITLDFGRHVRNLRVRERRKHI